MHYDVAIIGAGMSGLAAGIRLAHFGRKVCIFEQHDRVGGLNSYYHRRGLLIDVGLHAMTNYTGAEVKHAPLNKLLRQLRLRHAELDLVPQKFSRINFGAHGCLEFDNQPQSLLAAVSQHFPHCRNGMLELVQRIANFDATALNLPTALPTARQVLCETIADPLLREMLLCPLMYYGSAQEHDMEFAQFCIMFGSIFQEGFCRPRGGIKPLLQLLCDRFTASGGQLCLQTPVRRILTSGSAVSGVELADASSVSADKVLSSAGYLETLRLCRSAVPLDATHPSGQLAFTETVFVLDQPAATLGFDASIEFFNHGAEFAFRRPKTPIDYASGVLCVPDNFAEPDTAGTMTLRLTHLADYQPWHELEAAAYKQSKQQALSEQLALLEARAPGFRSHVQFTDMFTPKTISRYTGHCNGAIYGSPQKRRSGTTALANLYICGTDQGFLGITGAMLSGISIANAYLLR